jgi:putative ABC transport system ATP-binding protein
MTMLSLQGVWRVYEVGEDEVVALNDATVDIRDGEFIAVTGPSGSGKSTLLQIIGLLDRPSQGMVRLDGEDISDLSDRDRTEIRLRTLGFIFQRFHLLGNLTAIENVVLPMEVAGVPTAERYAKAASLLESVGLADRMSFVPAQLSGGQRQRVAIARALANEPRLLLADEPTGELHSEDKARVLELFRRLHSEGKTIIVVTHDMEVAAVAERHLEMRDGRLQEVNR